jgi:molybdenum cofactor biosynthesis enzyme MoaA
MPERTELCGFVLNTNGTLRPDLDGVIVDNGWLVAISLHGYKQTHEWYSQWGNFEAVVERIERLAGRTTVHIYTVLHDALTANDLDWLLRFRNESGAVFLRFILPRNFGRYRPLNDKASARVRRMGSGGLNVSRLPLAIFRY